MAQQQHVADVHPDDMCPPNKRYDLMDANKKIDLEHVQCPPESKILTNIIKNHPLRFSIAASSSVPWIYMAQFWHTLKEDGSKYRLKFMLNKKELSLTLDDFRTIFHLPQENYNNHDRFVQPSSFSNMNPFYKNELGFTMNLKTSSSFKTTELLWEGIHYSLHYSTSSIPYPRFTKIIIGHYMTNFLEISRRARDKYHNLKDDNVMKNIFNSERYKDKVGMRILAWMILEAMKHTEHYRMYAEVFGIDVPMTQSQPIANDILSQVDASDDPHDAHPERENSAKRQKISEYEAYVSGESSSGQEKEQGPSTSVQSCQRDPEAPTLSLINQDLLYLKKGSSGPEKIVLSLHKFPANPHAKIFYIRKQKEPGKPKEVIYSNSKIIQVIKTYWELGHEHKFITEIVARRANECIVSITKPDFKNLNKNDIEDMYLLIMNGKVPDYAETGLLWSLSVFIKSSVIWERVYDFQLGIESYQQKVNLTTPTLSFPGIEKHEMFSIIYEHVHEIIYKNSKKEKRVMRHSKIHMFCDATLNRVLEGLKSYNNDVKYGYIKKDLTKDEAEYLKLFEEEIEVRLKYRMQMRRWVIGASKFQRRWRWVGGVEVEETIKELRIKREAAERAFEAQAEKDRTLMRLEELRFLATSTKDLDDVDAYWIKKQNRLIRNKTKNDLGAEDDEEEDV
nr:hypothetical protein [Tanacetum cinerariifolium]